MATSRRVVVLRGGAGAGSTSCLREFKERGYEDVPTSALWYRPAALLGTDTYTKGGVTSDELPSLERVDEVYRELILPQLGRIGMTPDKSKATIDGSIVPEGTVMGALRDPRLPKAQRPGSPGIMQYFAGRPEGRGWANAQLADWVLGFDDVNFAIEGRDEGIPLTESGVQGLIKVYLDRSYSTAQARLKSENPAMGEGERFAWALTERDLPDILRECGVMLPEPNAVVIKDLRRLREAKELTGLGVEIILDTTSRELAVVSTFLRRLST